MSERWVSFDELAANESPFVQFDQWFDEAREVMREREAITLVTADANAQPSARMVLLRYRSERGFGFFTNYESRKGRELAANANAALLWYAEALGRQVRIEGPVHQLAASESDAYFASRPRGHQIGAHASHQSEPLASRAQLEQKVAALTEQFAGRDVPRPSNWGGYELVAERFEFWQHREDRLHDRVVYVGSNGSWQRTRIAP